MKIAIFGAGAIGSLFGAYLSRKHQVFLVGRKEHIESVSVKGLRVEGIDNFSVKIDGSTEYPGGADIIFLTVKSYDTENAMKSISPVIKGEFIVSLQNGIGNIEKISKYTENVIGAVTTEASTFVSPGIIKHTGRGVTRVGELKNRHLDVAVEIVRMLNDSGLSAEHTYDIRRDLWVKCAINSCINPLTAILNIKNGELLDENLSRLLECLINENKKVLSSMGIDIDLRGTVIDVIAKTGDNYSSMLQDIMRGKRTEIDSITGKIIEHADRNGIEVPCTKSLYYIMKKKESLLVYKK